VEDDNLAALYSAADCLVMPSWYEGFGIPVVEAMACGCPVVCSTGGCLPEVAGDAAVYVNPAEPADIAAGIQQVLEDPVLRATLVQRGLARSKAFSWKHTGQAMDQALRALVEVPASTPLEPEAR
jgi:glycosyltransferase involved in cell wall biosynthesis